MPQPNYQPPKCTQSSRCRTPGPFYSLPKAMLAYPAGSSVEPSLMKSASVAHVWWWSSQVPERTPTYSEFCQMAPRLEQVIAGAVLGAPTDCAALRANFTHSG